MHLLTLKKMVLFIKAVRGWIATFSYPLQGITTFLALVTGKL